MSKRIVLTGGPCAGKTTITEVLDHAFKDRLVIVPETASTLFKGGFPRFEEPLALEALQRAIYCLQKASEQSYGAHFPKQLLVLDRATVDGAAYWPKGSVNFFPDLGTTLEHELSRYSRVIYLESAGKEDYEFNLHRNPNRKETWEQAKKLDQETKSLWCKHPHFTVIQNNCSFSEKIFSVMKIIEEEIKS
jgi:predicted ATPase